MNRTQERELRHTSGVVPLRDIAFARGEGALLFDEEGRRYVDCAAGHGVAALGHAHPRLLAALSSQAERLITCAAGWPNAVRADYVARLVSLLPAGLERVFLCNSGTESIEAALKFARLATGRQGVVALERAFHGRTFGALSATANPKYRQPFEPLVPGFAHVPPNDVAALEGAVTAETACVLLELVQGEGGVHALEAAFVQRARELCDERGALLVVDEVQTGFGRTGRLFACEHYGLVPDLLCLGKAIGGGVPMGAVGIGPRVGELPPGSHGSTFGGNPLACAAGLAVLDAFAKDGLTERARTIGAWFHERLRGLSSELVRDVRGLGLMQAIELRVRAAPFVAGLLEEGIITIPTGTTAIRFLPPLVIRREELEQVLAALERVLVRPTREGASEEVRS